MVSVSTNTMVMDINNGHERISRHRIARELNSNLEVVAPPTTLPGEPTRDEPHGVKSTESRPAILPHPDHGLTDLPDVLDSQDTEPNPSRPQPIGPNRVTSPLEVLQNPESPPKEGAEKGNTILVYPASLALPTGGTPTQYRETASVDTLQTALKAPAALVEVAVSNEGNTPIREDTVRDVGPDFGNASEALHTRIGVHNTVNWKSVSADPDRPVDQIWTALCCWD